MKCNGFEEISCCTCCSVYVDVVQARILRERTEGVTACVVHYLHIPAVDGAAHGGTRCIKVDVVQATILRDCADGVSACVLSKRFFFFLFAPILAWTHADG